MFFGNVQYFACVELCTFPIVPAYSLAPLGPENALKTKIYFGAFPDKYIFFFLGVLGAMVPWCHGGAILYEHIGKGSCLTAWRGAPVRQRLLACSGTKLGVRSV